MYLLTELGRAGWENIWLSVILRKCKSEFLTVHLEKCLQCTKNDCKGIAHKTFANLANHPRRTTE